jgi:hypothetical protein
MNWIDESRRTAFESLGLTQGASRQPSELDNTLPDEIKERSIANGNELILGYDDALVAVSIATERSIAVLGFDSGEVLEKAFQVLDYSGYDSDVAFTGDWKRYVAEMNSRAERWIKTHALGRNHGYILTSASETEFAELDVARRQQHS